MRMKLPFCFVAFIALFIVIDAKAQLTKVAELPIANVTKASVDRLGNFYFIFPEGKMQKYDPDGQLLNETNESILPLTLIEPWNPLRIFLYSLDKGEISFLDHHLTEIENQILEPSLSITPILVCPANEVNKAWILDEADYTIKRVDLVNNTIEWESRLDIDPYVDPDFVFMREYQNRLFLLSKKKGIMVLNNLGKPITTIDAQGLEFFNFVGEELCYRKNDEIILVDLFTGTSRSVAQLQDLGQIVLTILTDERLVVINKSNIVFYQHDL